MTNNTPDYEDNLFFDSRNTKKDLCITVEKQVWESTLNRSMKLQAENTKLKDLLKENKRFTDILYNISYQTSALGGNKKEMERALLDIDYLCDLALRPYEIKELEND